MAKDTEKTPPKEKKKRSRVAVFFWSVTGALLLLLGLYAIIFYALPKELREVEESLGLTWSQDISELIVEVAGEDVAGIERNIEKQTSAADRRERKSREKTPAGLDFEGERSHQVKPGETLWAIAKLGELVDNPWEWRTILMQNADKIDYAFISAEDILEGKGAWKVMLAVGQELSVTQPPEGEYSGKMKGRKWLIQLAAVREARMSKAVSVVRTLMRDGYYANLERFEQGEMVWYRIRSGFYDSKEEASNTADKILAKYLAENLFPSEALVFPASSDERSGRGVVFGAQLANPWVVEFTKRNSHRDALRDLRRVKAKGNLAYIWQTLDSPDGDFVYQVRIGFFGSEEEAKAVFAGKSEGVWEGARTIRIDSLVETLPGQPHKLGGISF